MNNIIKKLIESFKNITKHSKEIGEGFGFVTKTTTALMTTILGAAKSVKNFGDKLSSIGNEAFANLSKSSNELLASFKNVKDFLSTKFIQFSNWTQGKENKAVNYTDGMNKIQLQTYSDLRKTGLISDTDNAAWIANAYNQLKALGYDELDANGRLSSIAQKAMNISEYKGIGDIGSVLNALLEINTTGKTDGLNQFGVGFNDDFYKGWLYEKGYNPDTVFTASKESQLKDEALSAYMQMTEYEVNAMKQLGFEVSKATTAIQAWEEVESLGSVDTEMGSTQYQSLSDSIKSQISQEDWDSTQELEEIQKQEALSNSELQAIKNNTSEISSINKAKESVENKDVEILNNILDALKNIVGTPFDIKNVLETIPNMVDAGQTLYETVDSVIPNNPLGNATKAGLTAINPVFGLYDGWNNITEGLSILNGLLVDGLNIHVTSDDEKFKAEIRNEFYNYNNNSFFGGNSKNFGGGAD